MGTRKSKHNQGRKAEYKEHHASEIFEEKRALPVVIGMGPEELPESGNDLPVIHPVTFGPVTTDKAMLDKPKKIRVTPRRINEFVAGQPSSASPLKNKSKRRRTYIAPKGVAVKKPSGYASKMHRPKRAYAIARYARPVRRTDEQWRRELGEWHWKRLGRIHYVDLLFRATKGLPTCAYEMDPADLISFFEGINLGLLTERVMASKGIAHVR